MPRPPASAIGRSIPELRLPSRTGGRLETLAEDALEAQGVTMSAFVGDAFDGVVGCSQQLTGFLDAGVFQKKFCTFILSRFMNLGTWDYFMKC